MAHTLVLTANQRLNDVAVAFHTHFPNLKLEFFAHTHARDEISLLRDRLSYEKLLSEVGHVQEVEEFGIHGNMKVSTFEQEFQARFGIGVQVLRRSGKLWLQTAGTDHWTLSKQNDEGAGSLSTDY